MLPLLNALKPFFVVLIKLQQPFCMALEYWTAKERRSSLLFPSWTSEAFILAFHMFYTKDELLK